MTMIMTVLTAIVVLVVVASPFFVGKGGMLAAAAAIQDKEQLQRIKQMLAARYLQDEQSFKNKDISERAWKARQEFLLRRFIDTARRLDYLEHIERAGEGSGT